MAGYLFSASDALSWPDAVVVLGVLAFVAFVWWAWVR